MFRKLTLSLILGVCMFLASISSFATIYVYDGVTPLPNPLSLNPGDSLHIAAGTYTGTVTGLNSDLIKITVANGATFQPTSLAPTNGVVCKIKNYGTFTYSQPLTTNTNFTLDNYAGGMVNLTTLNTKGKNQTWTNNIGGTINFSGNVLLNGGTADDDNNVFINYETINAGGDFQMNSGSVFRNYKDFTVAGNYKANGGKLRNEGNFVVEGNIDMNNGASEIVNYCRMQASGGISISNGNFTNYTYVWAKNSTITVTGSGVIQNVQIGGALPPIVHGRNYTQSGGTMSGPALLYFYEATSMTGGVMGVGGSTTDSIKMYDITRTNPAQIFDVQLGGTRHPNLIYNAWGAPDSNRVYLTGCSMEIFLEIPLAINWNSFVVDLFDNVPVVNWSAEFTRGTVFEVQRSYDGRNFSSIKTLQYQEGQSDYEYRDLTVNKQATIAYYRIKSTEVSSVEKYTQSRLVKLSHKTGSIYTAPNPYASNFIISYRAAEKETITVRMFNVSGQQAWTKNVTVNSGDNNINITEAAQLAKGIYVIQVSKGNKMISSTKIIKQ